MEANAKLQARLDAALESAAPADEPTPTPKKMPGCKRRPSKVTKTPEPEPSDHDSDKEEEDGEEGHGEVLTEGAKNNRLRRLCERKPSGKLKVGEEIHARWAQGGAERQALRDQLEQCDWDQDGTSLASAP